MNAESIRVLSAEAVHSVSVFLFLAMAFKLPPPPWQSPSWHGAPPALDDIIASLDEQRQARELALQLRLGIQDAQAEFSYLRVKGLRALAATVAACVADAKWTRRFRGAQLNPDLQSELSSKMEAGAV